MIIIAIEITEMHIQDQYNFATAINQFILTNNFNLINMYINRNGILCYIKSLYTPDIKDKIHVMLKHFNWVNPMYWGSDIHSTTVIKSIYISNCGDVYSGYMDIIPLVDSIKIPAHNSEDNVSFLRTQLTSYNIHHIEPYSLENDFIHYYAYTIVNPRIMCFEYTPHNIPDNIWFKFAREKEHLFIPIDNKSLLTCLAQDTIKNNMPIHKYLIGIEALIADICNIIKKDVAQFHIMNLHQLQYATNYVYSDHLNNLKQYVNMFKYYFGIDQFDDNWLKYYSIDSYCELIQQYPELKGSITQLIYPEHKTIIQQIVNMRPTNNHAVNLCIFCICYDRITWAEKYNYLPTGRGDQLGIKKNIRAIVDMLIAYQYPVFNELSPLIKHLTTTYMLKNNASLKYFKLPYYCYNIILNENHMMIVNRIRKMCKSIITISEHNNNWNEIESNIINSCNTLSNIHNILHNTNEYINNNVIIGNKNCEKLLHTVNLYLNTYLL